jgi:hypothetical protein
MPLIIEDGSIVANSDSWATRAEYIAYALSLGVTIADTDAADIQLRKAAEYIASHEANLKGYKVERAQSMAFPRYDVVIEDWYWSSDEIPRSVILCQMALALDINAGVDLYNKPANPGLVAKTKRVEGAITVQYAVPDNAGQKLSRSSRSDALLNSLLKMSGLVSIRMERT